MSGSKGGGSRGGRSDSGGAIKADDTFNELQTIEELRTYMKGKHQQLVDVLDDKGAKNLDVDMVRELLSQLDIHMRAYPELGYRLDSIGTRPLTSKNKFAPHTVAQVEWKGSSLHINPKAFKDRKTFAQNFTHSIQHIAAHEFGHVILEGIKLRLTNDVKAGKLSKDSTEYKKKWDFLQRNIDLHVMHKKGSSIVSDYAKTNSDEFFAETFAQMRIQGRRHNQYTNEIANMLNGI